MTSTLNMDSIMEVLRQVAVSKGDFIALHEPYFGGNEWNYVKECIDTGWVSSVGRFVDQFEEKLAEYTGVQYAVAVVNGTAALHMCLKLSGVEPDDEVLIPALTFVATANAVAYCGAVPHFIDSSHVTLGVDPQKLEAYLGEIAEVRGSECFNRKTGRRIKSVMPMHTFGHPVDLDPLMNLCHAYKLELIEDAAEAIGTLYKGKHIGNFGHITAMSFNGNKIVTTGGGGAILTNDAKLAKMAKHITKTAKVPHKWAFYHDELGYNYRLPNLNAALGVAQMEQLDKFLTQKRALAQTYSEVFRDVAGVTFFQEPEFARSNYWLNAILLDEQFVSCRDDVLERTNEENLMTRPAWNLLNRLPMYRECPSMDLGTAESIESRLINIPSSAILGERLR